MYERMMKIKIHDESDLYSDFDPDQRMLSEDMVEYIVRCFQGMKTGRSEDHVIQICSDMPIDEESVAEKIREKG